MGKSLLLNESLIRREVAYRNRDVLAVIGFALFPSIFTDDVEVYLHPHIKDAFVYEVRESGRSYILFIEEVLRVALAFGAETGRTPEVLEPISDERPTTLPAGKEAPCPAP